MGVSVRLFAAALSLLVFLTSCGCTMTMTAYAADGLPSVGNRAVYYTPAEDYRPGDCILTAAKMMIRRAAVRHGSAMWNRITNETLRPCASPGGALQNSFTFSADGMSFRISCGYFSSDARKSDRTKEIRSLLKTNTNGIVVWGAQAGEAGAHGVLVTSVSEDGIIRAADSANNTGQVNSGIEKWGDTTMRSVSRCTKYWYLEAVSGTAASAEAKASSTLTVHDIRAPREIRQGNGFTIRGIVESNYLLRRVTVRISDNSGRTVISRSASPDAWIYDIHRLDPYVKFGTLSPGTYTYRIRVTDRKTSRTLVKRTFRIVRKPLPGESTLRLTAGNYPKSIVEGEPFTIRGTVRSNYRLKRVRIFVKDSSGKVVLSASAAPGVKKYSLAELDRRIKFGTLSRGSYRYKVTAKDKKQKKTLISRSFTVR